MVERLVRQRWRIHGWHTGRVDGRELLDRYVVDRGRWRCRRVVDGPVRGTDRLLFDSGRNVEFAVSQHNTITLWWVQDGNCHKGRLEGRRHDRQCRAHTYIILELLCFVFRFERDETVPFAHTGPVDDDLCRFDIAVRGEQAA